MLLAKTGPSGRSALESHAVPGIAAGQWSGTMSVLHVLAPAPAGGLERVVRALTRAQAALGYRVTVAAIVHPPVPSSPSGSADDPHATTLAALQSPSVTVIPVVVAVRGYWEERRRVVEI